MSANLKKFMEQMGEGLSIKIIRVMNYSLLIRVMNYRPLKMNISMNWMNDWMSEWMNE